MAGTLEIAFKLIGLLMTLFIIYLVVAGSVSLALYTRIGQGDPKGFWYTDREKLKKYIFKSWIDWAGNPATFSSLSSNTVTTYMLYKKVTGNNILSNCMIQCESSNSRGKTPKCVGFIYETGTTSNTCHLASTMDGIMSSPPTSNTLYFIDGLDTAREYKTYTSNTQVGATYLPGSPYTTSTPTEPIECMANCASRADCTGFIVTGTTCGLASNLDPTKFISNNGSGILYLTKHSPLKASTISYY
jgi:hypothetical protein